MDHTDFPLAPIREAFSSLLGRLVWFAVTITAASTTGLSFGMREFVAPWNATMGFVGAALLVLFTGGWGLLVYPLVVFVFYIYLVKELPHWVMSIPFVAVAAYMFHLGRLFAASACQ